jgi:transketolase
MYDFAGLAALTARAKAEARKPSLIVLKSIIGKGSPNKQGHRGHPWLSFGRGGSRQGQNGDGHSPGQAFWVAPEAYAYFEKRRAELKARKDVWQKVYEAWGKANPEKSEELSAWFFNRPLKALDLPAFAKGDKIATRNASGKALAAVATSWPNLVGGSADLTSPNVTQLPANPSGLPLDFTAGNPGGRYIRFGVREHGMAAIANGLALYGGFRPFVATFLVFADYLRPSLRLAALMKLPVIYVLTHDSVYIARTVPPISRWKPWLRCGLFPTARSCVPPTRRRRPWHGGWRWKNTDGPTVLALSRQNLPVMEKDDPEWPYTMAWALTW